MTIHEELKATGAILDTYNSDLYAEVTPETMEIIARYEFKKDVTTFKDKVTGKRMYDIPFANDNFRKV